LTWALLLAWQCEAALALVSPEHAIAADVTHVEHCVRHAATTTADSGQPTAPSHCCHQVATACQCPQLPALAPPMLFARSPRATVNPPPLRSVAHIEARSTDFFRPPI